MLSDDDIAEAQAAIRRPVARRARWFWDVEGAPLDAVARFYNRADAEMAAVILSRGRPLMYRAVRYAVN